MTSLLNSRYVFQTILWSFIQPFIQGSRVYVCAKHPGMVRLRCVPSPSDMAAFPLVRKVAGSPVHSYYKWASFLFVIYNGGGWGLRQLLLQVETQPIATLNRYHRSRGRGPIRGLCEAGYGTSTWPYWELISRGNQAGEGCQLWKRVEPSRVKKL